MFEKSVREPAFYRPLGRLPDGRESFDSLPTTAGPWSPDAQHGGPPAALLARAAETCADLARPGASVLGRVTVELWGPVPVGPLSTRSRVLRPGRSVELVEAELYDAERDRLVASARAWVLPATTTGPAPQPVAPPYPREDGRPRPRPEGWHGGYLDAVEWAWVRGGLEEPGSGVVWMRPPRLVEGETTSPVQRLMACVDSASGVSAALDVREWAFLNTELSVHVVRPPVGEWVCLDAETTLGPGAVGLATSLVHDELGVVGRSAQTLLVVPR